MGFVHCFFAVAGAINSLTTAASVDVPHILLITTDQHQLEAISAYSDIGAYTGIKSPHIDKLASEGVKFTQAHATSPVCSPCRTSTSQLYYCKMSYVIHAYICTHCISASLRSVDRSSCSCTRSDRKHCEALQNWAYSFP